ncbi:MAG: type II toxin-antitoxin system PemK/MazF family toxin [Terracidiphilus sp.]|jgi:mRNA-degrading endonuclease toxin of MazEF toxin-antitoxin module
MTAWKRGTKPFNWYPHRGDICLISLEKERPALIISSDSLNAHSLDVCVLPISKSELRAFSLRPKLKAGDGGLNFDSWVKCDQPTTLEKQLVIYPPLGSISLSDMQQVEMALKTSLDLS